MLRLSQKSLKFQSNLFTTLLPKCASSQATKTPKTLPQQADVVIIGGGTVGCHTLYFLAKRGINAVLLERAQLTSGTTWHTNGAMWRLRPNDVDIHLLGKSFEVVKTLQNETEYDPGYIQNGGIFIAHNETRMDEYKRLSTIGNLLQIENTMMSADEITKKLFPLLDPKSFIGGLYSPGDGCLDPAMLCRSLAKEATKNGGKIFEDCFVSDVIVKENIIGNKKVQAVVTSKGTIKTNMIVNATGVWAGDLSKRLGIDLPIIPMKHTFIVTEGIEGLKGLPNVRDHDYSICFRIQGSSICLGGYETNPILLDSVPEDFRFQLYDLDWDTFDEHVKGAEHICPAFGRAGIKSTVCGPESFTPDHKPLMGPDPRLDGLFHISGFNSAGIMYGGGCADQLVQWMVHGKPELPMYNYDVRRFSPKQTSNRQWAVERSHEAYATNYHTVFLNNQPMAARNFIKDPFHEILISNGAVMQEKHGWERPAFFLNNEIINVPEYDWQGAYGNTKLIGHRYQSILEGDAKYGFSDHHHLIGTEAKSCRTNAGIINLSSQTKFFIHGPQALEAVRWIFTADITEKPNKVIPTCALNNAGGIECFVNIVYIDPESSEKSIFESPGFYIIGDGSAAYQTYCHINSVIKEKSFKVTISDVSSEYGVLSLQGANSGKILQQLTDFDLSDEIKVSRSSMIPLKIKDENSNQVNEYNIRVFRISSIGELGYELHIPVKLCSSVYHSIWEVGQTIGLKNVGFRAFNSLSCEKGLPLWDYDIRSDDTPIEASLKHKCRLYGDYKGKPIIEEQLKNGVKRRLVYLVINDQVPIWGLESVYRNGKAVGYLRRAEYAYELGKSIGKAYVERSDGKNADVTFITSGSYEVEVLGKRYSAKCYLKSPFDPEDVRIRGNL